MYANHIWFFGDVVIKNDVYLDGLHDKCDEYKMKIWNVKLKCEVLAVIQLK